LLPNRHVMNADVKPIAGRTHIFLGLVVVGCCIAEFENQLGSAGIDFVLPRDDCLRSIRSVIHLITLTDTTESEVMAEIEKLYMANLSFHRPARKAAQVGEFKR
jgi:hypothetical protein